MAKVPENTRFDEILAAARAAFIHNAGFRRTQIAEVARRAGVAPGTAYLYVTSKEALFEGALLAADDPDWAAAQTTPFVARPLPDLIEFVRASILEDLATLQTLSGALASNRCGGVEEFERIVGELYDLFYRRRDIVRLLEACAQDFPQLAEMYFANGRVRIAEMLIRYLTLGQTQHVLRIVGDPVTSARQIIETIAFWAIHRHWDLAPMAYDESDVRADAIVFATAPFVR